MLNFLIDWKRQGKILAMHDRSDGGLLTTMLEMSFAARTGINIELAEEACLLPALFNEEIGVVLQIAAADLANLMAIPSVKATVVGSVRTDDQVFIRQADEVLFTASRGKLQLQWALTSYTMQRRRDSAACADEEFASLVITRDENPGLSARLTFDPSQAPAVISAGTPTVAILREQGVDGRPKMAQPSLLRPASTAWICICRICPLAPDTFPSFRPSRHVAVFPTATCLAPGEVGLRLCYSTITYASSLLIFLPQTPWLWEFAMAVKCYPSYVN